MPRLRPSCFKNASGLLYESAIYTHTPRSVSFGVSSLISKPLASTNARNLSFWPFNKRETGSPPELDLYKDVPILGYSLSISNPGPVYNPYYEPPKAPVDPTPIPAAATNDTLDTVPFDPFARYYTLSVHNTGEPLPPIYPEDYPWLFPKRPSIEHPKRSEDWADNIMASDEDYANFLDKANADRNPPQKTQSKPAVSQKTVNTENIHPALQNVHQHVYISDADESFEPVSLKRAQGKSGSVEKGEIAQLASVSADKVEEIGRKEFDPRGQYDAVWKAVSDAANGGVNAFKVEKSGTRVEYWVVGADNVGNVVGARALAVES